MAGDISRFPLRCALIRVINDGNHFDKVSAALVVQVRDAIHGKSEMVLLVPRNDNVFTIVGLLGLMKGNLNLILRSPVIQRMRQRCETFLTGLKNVYLDTEYPLAQGLRPF